MKSPVLTLLLFLTLFYAQSQSRDAGQRFIRQKCGALHVNLPVGQWGQQYPLLFDSISVLDWRSDTSRIGLISGGRSQKEILLHEPVTAQLTRYLNAGFTAPTAKHHLLIGIKNLWVSDLDGPQLNTAQGHWVVSFRFEAYLASGDGYIALTYLDTVATFRGNIAEVMLAHRLPELIALFMQKTAARTSIDDLTGKRVIPYGEIDSFARSRFYYAMDTATKLVKGVYTTIDEFKNNAPSILNYEISRDKSSLIELRIPDENGQMYYTHKMWGFCDGEQTYMMMDGNVFPVFSVGHQFYVLGSKEYLDKKVWVPFFLPIGGGLFALGASSLSDNVIRKMRIFRLNIESGEVTE